MRPGVTLYDPAKAYGTLILFSGADQKTHLVDMNGRKVHRWDYPGFPSGILDPALAGGRRGHVMVELSMMKADACAAKTPLLLGNMTLGTSYTCG